MTLELVLGLLLAGTPQAATSQSSPPPSLAPGDRVVVTDDRRSLRGRIAEITTESLVLQEGHTSLRIPLGSVQRIDRIGDSLFNGAAIGTAIGGGTALALMAKACTNSSCADTSTSLDPRITLMGALIGAGVGAIIDKAIEGRRTIYTAGAIPQLLTPSTRIGHRRHAPVMFGRFGWSRFTDDEGWLGDGATIGFGMIVPFSRRFGINVAYDRHHHRRDFEPAVPSGMNVSTGGFNGTEQLLTAKAQFFFRSSERVRPYAGIGIGLLESKRVSEFPTFVSQPGRAPVPGPLEVLRYRTRAGGLGFGAGLDVRVTNRLSVLGDLTLDLNGSEALGSTRLTVGAGWHF